MSLTSDDLTHLGRLAQLALGNDEATRLLEQLNDFVDGTAAMCAANTAGAEPLVHLTTTIGSTSLRLQEDTVTEPNRREIYLRTAPATQDGLFLVPRVIE